MSSRGRLALLALLVLACDADDERTSSVPPTTLGDDGSSESESGGGESESMGGDVETTESTSSSTDEGPTNCSSDEECGEGEFCLVETCTPQTWPDCPEGAEISVSVAYRDADASEPEFELVYDKCVGATGFYSDPNTVRLDYFVRPNLQLDDSRLTLWMPDGTWANNPLEVVDGTPATLTWDEDNPAVPTSLHGFYDKATGELTRIEYEKIGSFTIVGITFEGTLASPSKVVDLVVVARLAFET